MFPINDPQLQLDLHHQRVAERIREVEDQRRARTTQTGRHRRLGRWPSRVATAVRAA